MIRRFTVFEGDALGPERRMTEEEKCQYPSSVVRRLLFHSRDIIRQIQYLLIGDRLGDRCHERLVAMARIVLVAAQRLDQIILALGGDMGNVILSGEARGMAEVATVLMDQRPGAF